MCHLDNTKEQLIDALKQRELEIVEALNLKRDLYTDLANSLPTGMYRTRVFYDVSLIEDKWSSSKDSPYVIEFANDRFYEILHLDKLTLDKNPGIINDLIYEEDKADFARLNVEANLHKIPFSWEGRFLINDQIIWIHFKSIPRILENGDIIWTGTLEDISRRKQTEQVIRHKNAQRSDSGTTVTVSDNGVGIAPEMLPKLFDIKVVYSTKGTAQEKGTGLGLLLCKEFVNKHGGKIWVESQLKKGSEFKFTLPLNETLST